jgi:hypothetical protein
MKRKGKYELLPKAPCNFHWASTQQYFVKNVYTHFNENPLNGLVADIMSRADKECYVKTKTRGFQQSVILTL